MSINKNIPLGFTVHMDVDFQTAASRTVEALKTEGFGILTEIDVKETFKKKLGVDVPAYKILGACNPPLAHQAMTSAPEAGLLLPCNVTIRDLGDGSIEVSAVDPLVMLSVIDNPALQPVAAEAHTRLERAIQSLKEPAAVP